MDKRFILTILMLVYLVAVVYSQPSCMCQKDDTNQSGNKKGPDLRLEFTSDPISDTTITKQYLCNVITTELETTIKCNENSFLTSCSDADPKWSVWTDCAMSNGQGIMYRYRDVTSSSGKSICCLPPCISLIDRQECNLYAGNPSTWSNWSECITSGEGYKHRSLKCHSNQSECLVPSNGSSFEISTCIPASPTSEKENGKEVEKRYTLTEIILVALCCFLMGVIITSLVFVLYIRRTQQGCFSKDNQGVQGDSKQQSGPEMKFLTENVVVKKNDPNDPTSADSKNENKVEETQYQLINSNQVGNDQQTYDQINVNEARSNCQGHQPSSSRLQQTANDYHQIDQITNLQHTNEGVYEYGRDSEIDGHNYFVLERENMSRESGARNLGRPETHAEVGDEVKDSTLGTENKESDASHEYFLLERFENGHNQD